MARSPADDDDDYSLEVGAFSAASHPTMELDTSDLSNMAQSGVAQAKPKKVIQLSGGEEIGLEPGWSHSAPSESIVIEDTLAPSAHAQRAPVAAPVPVVRALPAVRPEAPRGGAWMVVLVYVIAATALGLALYERFS